MSAGRLKLQFFTNSQFLGSKKKYINAQNKKKCSITRKWKRRDDKERKWNENGRREEKGEREGKGTWIHFLLIKAFHLRGSFIKTLHKA